MAVEFVSELSDKLGRNNTAESLPKHIKVISAPNYQRTDNGVVTNPSLQTALDGKQNTLPTTGTASSTYAINISGTAGSVKPNSLAAGYVDLSFSGVTWEDFAGTGTNSLFGKIPWESNASKSAHIYGRFISLPDDWAAKTGLASTSFGLFVAYKARDAYVVEVNQNPKPNTTVTRCGVLRIHLSSVSGIVRLEKLVTATTSAVGSSSIPTYVNQYGVITACTDDFVHTGSIDQSYDGTSSNPQSGTAVAEAVSGIETELDGKASISHTHTVKINGTEKTIAATGGTAVDLGTYLTAHQAIKQDGITGATVNRFGTCSTAAATAAKTVSITTGTFSLEAGAMVAVKFTNKNTANSPTLAVGSTAAKTIFVNGAQITSGANKGLLAGTVIFIYDGTQYHLIGNYYDSNSTGYATQFSLGAIAANTVTYTNFASMGIANTQGNGEAQVILASGTGIGGTNMGTWHITVSNRNSTAATPRATMTVRCLNKQSQTTPPEFGYYYDTANALIYFGVKSPEFRGNNTITVLSNSGATLKDFGDVTTEPSGWTAVTITEYSTTTHNHDSVYLKLTGGTMTGQLVNTMAGDDSAFVAIHGTSGKNSAFRAVRTDTDVSVFMGVGTGGTNHGVYSETNANWIIRADTSGNVFVNDGKATSTVRIGNSDVGSSTKPVYIDDGVIKAGSTYAGGTAVTLNGTSASGSTASFYAPTGAGTSNYVLKSNGSGAPTWVEKAPKASAADSATNSTNSAVTADTTHQLYLIGATGSSGQQALKTDTGIYATATAGQLHATTFDVNSKCTLQFNTTTNALDFVFA